MPSFTSDPGNVLYLIICACPPASDAPELVKQLQFAGWDVYVTATEHALDWIDVRILEATSGHPVRTRFRRPDESDDVPLGNALLVAPASFNTINKWANGINDSLALGLLNEGLGRRIRAWATPWFNEALASHPALARNLDELTEAGVIIVRADFDRFAVIAAESVGSPALLP
jgi:phosphopantothenoylcysteine decarboxylase